MLASAVTALTSPERLRADLALVDDDPAVRQALAFAFDIAGLRVVAFPDAEAALAAPDSADWHCLIIDQHLPGMSGLDLLGALRNRGFEAPSILITSNPGPELRRRAHAAGVEIVEKPLLDEELSRRVLRLIAPAG